MATLVHGHDVSQQNVVEAAVLQSLAHVQAAPVHRGGEQRRR